MAMLDIDIYHNYYHYYGHITLLQRMSLCRILSMRGWVGFAL